MSNFCTVCYAPTCDISLVKAARHDYFPPSVIRTKKDATAVKCNA